MKVQLPRAPLIALVLGFSLLLPGLTLAQSSGWGTGSGLSAGAGIGYEVYRFATPAAANIESLSLRTSSFGTRLPLGTRSVLMVQGGHARGVLERADGSEASVEGFTDTDLSVGISFGPPRFAASVTGILVLPTGHSTHTAAEATVAGAIAADLLPFRITNWGSGGGAGLSAGAVHALERGSVGLSAGYLVAREFEPIQAELQADRFAYRPGNQLQLRAGIDHRVGSSGKATLSLLFQRHSDDALEDANLYRAGNRFQGMGSYAFAAGGRSSGIVYGGALHRQRGTALLELSHEIPAQTLLLLGGGLRLPFRGGILLPSIDSRLFRTEDGIGQGHLTGLGASMEYPFNSVTLLPTVRARFGSVLVRRGSESGITGVDIGLAIRFHPL